VSCRSSKFHLSGPNTIAALRIATSILFLSFGEYKVFRSGFAHVGFQKYLQGYIDGEAVSFYRPVLTNLVLPHAVWELLVGISLLIGLWVQPASIAGIILLLNLTLAAWFAPGHDAPTWQYFGNETGSFATSISACNFLREQCGRDLRVR